jgi:hypothetical protein
LLSNGNKYFEITFSLDAYSARISDYLKEV